MFDRFALKVADIAGRSYTFGVAVLLVLVWAISGPIFGFSATWQLVINTGTTIITFFMVFLIQNAQNRDTRALHLKLDNLILAIDAAQNDVIDAELQDSTWIDQTLARLRTEIQEKES